MWEEYIFSTLLVYFPCEHSNCDELIVFMQISWNYIKDGAWSYTSKYKHRPYQFIILLEIYIWYNSTETISFLRTASSGRSEDLGVSKKIDPKCAKRLVKINKI